MTRGPLGTDLYAAAASSARRSAAKCARAPIAAGPARAADAGDAAMSAAAGFLCFTKYRRRSGWRRTYVHWLPHTAYQRWVKRCSNAAVTRYFIAAAISRKMMTFRERAFAGRYFAIDNAPASAWLLQISPPRRAYDFWRLFSSIFLTLIARAFCLDADDRQ